MSQQPGALKIWYEGGGGPDPGWERTVARAQFLSRAPLERRLAAVGHHRRAGRRSAVRLAAALAAAGGHPQHRNRGLAGLVLPVLMAFLYAAWNDPTKRRAIGVLWDVGTFWPRSYHPLSPPCYAERAVPELQRRMWWLHDNGGRVVLVAHSQGAMLATAALVQSGCRPEGDHPSLVTFGSPVVKLYGWGFPAYVTPGAADRPWPPRQAGVDDWCNHFYPTDPIGGTCGRGPVPGRRPAGWTGTCSIRRSAGTCTGSLAPTPQGHCGYWADPRVWAVVDRLAATAPRIPIGSGTALNATALSAVSNGWERQRRRPAGLEGAWLMASGVVRVVPGRHIRRAELEGVRRVSLAALIMLVVQYGLGIILNLYIPVPASDAHAGLMQEIASGPFMLTVHALLGLGLIGRRWCCWSGPYASEDQVIAVLAAAGLTAIGRRSPRARSSCATASRLLRRPWPC